jgi:hypothetical protein
VSQFDILDQRHALCWDLATMRAVKYTPQGDVLGNVLELMLDPRSDEQEVARLEPVSLAVVNEYSSAANDEVNLVPCMRRLLARAQREAKGYVESATLQDHDGALARGARDTRLSLGKTDNTATTWLAHASLL